MAMLSIVQDTRSLLGRLSFRSAASWVGAALLYPVALAARAALMPVHAFSESGRSPSQPLVLGKDGERSGKILVTPHQG